MDFFAGIASVLFPTAIVDNFLVRSFVVNAGRRLPDIDYRCLARRAAMANLLVFPAALFVSSLFRFSEGPRESSSIRATGTATACLISSIGGTLTLMLGGLATRLFRVSANGGTCQALLLSATFLASGLLQDTLIENSFDQRVARFFGGPTL